MSIKTQLLFFVSSSFFLVPTVQGHQTTDAQRSITAIYKQTDAATARKDTRTILSFMTSDYRIIFKGKTLPKSRVVGNIKHTFSLAKTLSTTTSIKQFSFKQGKVTVVAREVASATFINAHTHKTSILTSDSLFEDAWVKQRGRWLKQKTTNLQFKAVVNGKGVEVLLDGKVIQPTSAK